MGATLRAAQQAFEEHDLTLNISKSKVWSPSAACPPDPLAKAMWTEDDGVKVVGAPNLSAARQEPAGQARIYEEVQYYQILKGHPDDFRDEVTGGRNPSGRCSKQRGLRLQMSSMMRFGPFGTCSVETIRSRRK